MQYKSGLIFPFVALSVLFLSCADGSVAIPGSEKPSVPLPLRAVDESDKRLARAINGFAFGLFDKLSESSDTRQNTVISPFSITSALAMVMDGASGQTLEDMKTAMGIEGTDAEAIDESWQVLTTTLQQLDKDIVLEITNAIFAKDSFGLLDSYIERIKKFHIAEHFVLDLMAAGATEAINEWISERTHRLVNNMLDEETVKNADALLVNTIYMNVDWATPFEKSSTSGRNFTTRKGPVVQVDMMADSDRRFYHSTDDYTAVSLPYKYGHLSFVAMLPQAGRDVSALIEMLRKAEIVPGEIPFHAENVVLHLPVLNISFKKSLVDNLKQLGLGRIFNRGLADFTRMNPSGLTVVSDVIHQTVVKVHEKGTEAAGVTVVSMDGGSAADSGSVEWKEFNANRPFIFLIQHNTSGAVLFMATVNNPGAVQ